MLTSCPSGAAGPSPSGRCFTKTMAVTSSLRGCITLCGEQAQPACLTEEDFTFLAASSFIDPQADYWLGVYRRADSIGNSGPSFGYEHCISGQPAPAYHPWRRGRMDPFLGPYSACAHLSSADWQSTPCDMQGVFSLNCLCASTDDAMGPTAQAMTDLADGEVVGSLWLTRLTEATWRIYGIALGICLLPALLFFASRAAATLQRRTNRAPGGAAAESSSAESVEFALRAARRSAANRRVQVSGLLLNVGWSFLVISWVPMLVWVVFGIPLYRIAGQWSAWLGLFPSGIALMLLALFPTDERAIRVCAVFLFTFLSMASGLIFFVIRSLTLTFAIGMTFTACGLLGAAFILAPTLPCACQCPQRAMSPRATLRRLWMATRLAFSGCAIVNLNWAVQGIARYGSIAWLGTAAADEAKGALACSGCILVVVILTTPRNRAWAHQVLGSLGRSGVTKEAEAATIAALVQGSGSAEHALAEGCRRFRALPLASLKPDDLDSNRKDGSMFTRTVGATLGKVDAFVSHSWSDPGAAKFKQLSSWGEEVQRTEGRDALIWLDKACIDQGAIQANLAALPVFLSGCHELVVLAGETYASRLWCVVELFVFLRMGGEVECLRVYELGGADVRSALNSFDAAKAQCFLQSDRERMLAVIESGFGALQPFNEQVRGIFGSARVASLEAKVGRLEAEVQVLLRFMTDMNGRRGAEPEGSCGAACGISAGGHAPDRLAC